MMSFHNCNLNKAIFPYQDACILRFAGRSLRPMRRRVDWLAAKAEYVNDFALTLVDIAGKYGISDGGVRARAHREGWTEARNVRARLLEESVQQKTISSAAQELAHFNRTDIEAAKVARSMVLRKFADAQAKVKGRPDLDLPLEARDLRALVSVLEVAQRVARLALGASTSNDMGAALDPLMAEIRLETLSDNELATFEQLLVKAIGNSQKTAPTPGRRIQ